MSGIVGIVNIDGKPVKRSTIEAMANAAAYRGKDGINYWIKGNIGLAQMVAHEVPGAGLSSLPVLDSESGLLLVADARIDDRNNLKNMLLCEDFIKTRDPTDAELILGAYKRWGYSCVEHIVGDFAFAIVDTRNKEIFLARDTVGARPLHYNYDGRCIRFASDARQIIADTYISRDIDGYALCDRIVRRFDDQARTLYASVQRVRNAHCLTIRREGVSGRCYWRPDLKEVVTFRNVKEYVDHFRYLLDRSVADRMRSNAAGVAILTSGGVDSSSVAAVTDALYKSGRTNVRPVAVHIALRQKRYYDETIYFKALVEHTGIDHRSLVLDGKCLEYASEDIGDDDPILWESQITREEYNLFRELNCGVVLTGYGGDSLFDCGRLQYWDAVRRADFKTLWPWLKALKNESDSWATAFKQQIIWPWLPSWLRRNYSRVTRSGHYAKMPDWVGVGLRRNTATRRRPVQTNYKQVLGSRVRQIQIRDMVGMGAQTMAILHMNLEAARYGMDACHPLLDSRISEFLVRVPANMLAQPGRENSKWLLRQSVKSDLPSTIFSRGTKAGISAYIDKEVKTKLHAKYLETFAHSYLGGQQLVDERQLIRAYQFFVDGVAGYRNMGQWFYRVYNIEKWLRARRNQSVAIRFNELCEWQ